MIKMICRIALLACTIATASAQSDSSKTLADTSETPSRGIEEMLDESAGLDGSSILDFVRESRSGPSNAIHVRAATQISQRLQPSAGYANGSYGGSRIHVRQRATIAYGHLSSGVLYAKDAGERAANAFVSGFFSYTGDGFLRRASVGDYRIEAGQGISMWRGRDFSKGSDILAPALRRGRGVVPALSSDETTYLRGAALEASLSGVDATLFVSARSSAASIDTDGTVRMLYASGYYRTESEVQKRGALAERLYGARISAGVASMHHFGLTFYRTNFSLPLSLGSGARFAGSGYTLAAVDYAGYFRGMSAFAEVVMAGRTFAGVGGVALVPSGGFTLAVVARAYPLSFYSAHGAGFGDAIDNSNEYGMYIGAQKDAGRLTVSGYIDRTLIPMEHSRHFPTAGNDLYGRIQVRVTENVSTEVQYHRSSKVSLAAPEDGPEEENIDGRNLLQRIRVQGACRFNPGCELRIRCERSFLADPALLSPENGLLVYGDLAMRLGRFASANFRLVLFATDSYATRIAEYERDLNGVASIPSLYGSGVRWYLLLRLKPMAGIQLNVKYSDLVRDDVRSIGSGLEALTTNHDNRLSAEVGMTF